MSGEGKLKVYRASAGSGKTFRLAVEFIALLVKDPTAYRHILAVTFTNKATGEMKQRILSQLYGIAHGLRSSDHYLKRIIEQLGDEGFMATEELVVKRCDTALTAILHDYSNFHIVTIDSFFQSIVRELANELGVAANISVELDADAVMRQAVDEIIDNLSVSSPEYDSLVHYIQSRFDDAKSWKIDETVAEFGTHILSEHFLIHDSSVRDIISDKQVLDDYYGRLKTFQAVKVERFNSVIASNLATLLQALQATGEEERFNKVAMKMLAQDWTALAKWKDTYDKYTESAGAWVTAKLRGNDVVQSVVDGTLMPCFANIKEAVCQRTVVMNDTEAARQHIYNLMIVGKISEQIDAINRDRNRFLMAETAHFLRDVINKSNLPFIYEKTGTVIRHIMIDEFQDTSTLQWGNFMPLLTECLDAGNSCLIVGDVKQSIYRFRNSDWQVLNGIDSPSSPVSHYVRNITPAVSVNRRSAKRVIDFNNRFFQHTLEWAKANYASRLGSRVEALSTAYSTVEQKPVDDAPELGYVHVENAPDVEDDDSPQLVSLMRNITELLDAGVEQKDITILVRKGRHAAEICQYVEEHRHYLPPGLNIVSDEAFLLGSSAAVNIIVYAMRSLSAINDRLHLATLAYHYQTAVLGNQSVADDVALPLLASDDELVTRYLPAEFIARRDALRFKPLAEIVEEVYSMFGLERIDGQDAYLAFFHDTLKQYTQDNQTDLASFLRAWDDELHAKSIPNGQADGISIMTIHKSKGLEFHTVIVPYCNWSLDPKDSTLLWHSNNKESNENEEDSEDDMPMLPLMPVNYSKTKNSQVFRDDHDDETLLTLVDNINVLYVAFTRAVNNLVIIIDEQPAGRSKDALGANSLLLSFIGDGDLTEGEIVPSKKAEDKSDESNPLTRSFARHTSRFVSVKTLAEFRQSNDSDLFIAQQSDRPSAQEHAERIRLISLGNLYHNIMQQVNTPDDLHRAVMRLDTRGCFDRLADRDETEQRLHSLIESVGKEFPEWFSPDWTPINERTILCPSTFAGKTFLSKRPDRVVVKDDTAIVIDYKTAHDAAEVRPDGTVAAPSENVKQVKEYCQLMRQLGYKNVKGYLWYIIDNVVYSVV